MLPSPLLWHQLEGNTYVDKESFAFKLFHDSMFNISPTQTYYDTIPKVLCIQKAREKQSLYCFHMIQE